MQKSSLRSAIALVVGAVLALPAAAAQDDPADVVAQKRSLAVWSSLHQQAMVVEAQLTLAKKQQELEALQGSSARAKAAAAAAEATRKDTGMPVVARISGESGKLFAVVTYPDGQEAELGAGERLRGSGCRVESVSDSAERGVPVRCGKKTVRLKYASERSASQAGAAAPQTQAVTQPGFQNAQLSPPAMIPVTVGQPPISQIKAQ
ncbi:type IV pilus biogenesis protein PilP [Cupriavidus sp. CP313]